MLFHEKIRINYKRAEECEIFLFFASDDDK